MLFSSLTALCTQLFSLFTFTSVGDEALHAGSIKKLGHSDPSFESSSGDDQVVHNAPSNPYRLTDKWQGSNFFDGWDFWTHNDPTHGLVNYVDKTTAAAKRLTYVDGKGVAVMKVDSLRNLPSGAHRDSVRISTKKSWNEGLFVLDAQKFPYGCAVWPAWWMVGPDWPNNGEVDIFEGVNIGNSNQYTAHTAAGCNIAVKPSPEFTVSPSSSTRGATSCGPNPNNSGCYFIDNSGNTYGANLNAHGGAVLAMEWKQEGIRIWNFPRGQVPQDLQSGHPSPQSWPTKFLKAAWENKTCPINGHFRNMSIVFDITLCGDWAGSAYPKSGCPGSCAPRVTKGSNFNNAAWAVNYVAVYSRK